MSQYQENTSGTLPSYNAGYEQMLNAGAAAANTPFQAYTGQQVANFAPQQNQAFELASSNVNNWRPNIDQAQSYLQGSMTAGQPGYDQAQAGLQGVMGSDLQNLGWSNYANAQGLYMGSSQFDPSQVQQHLNPYLSGVVGEIGRLGQEQFSEQIVPTLSNAYSSLGQFGSARQGMMLSDAAARNQRETLGQQGQFLHQGYDSAMRNYGDWANRAQSAAAGMTDVGRQQYQQGLGQAQTQMAGAAGLQNLGAQRSDDAFRAGTAMGNLGQARQQLGISDYGQLLSAGTLQQSQNQKVLDTQKQNWDQQQQYPWQQVQNWAQLFPAAPQVNSSWGSTFKKGGLAHFKKGGVVKGMADGGLFQDSSDISTILAQLSSRPLSPAQERSSLPIEAYASRSSLMAQLQPTPKPSFGHRAGRAMMESAAQQPTNWGQAIGQSGKAFYANEDARLADNAARAAASGKLMGLGRGSSVFEGKVVPGVGLVNYDPNTGEANVVMAENRVATMLPQLYAHAVREASAAQWPNEGTKRRWIDRRVQQMLSDAASRGAGVKTPGEGSLPGGMPPGATPIGMQQPRFVAEGDDVEKAVRDIASIGDPNERRAAMEALQRSYPQSRQPSPPVQEGWPALEPAAPSAHQTGQILSPQERHESERVGTGLGDTYNNLQQDAADARSKINRVTRIGNLLADVKTGKLTPAWTEVQGWADALGIEHKYLDGLSEKQAAQSLMGQFALQLRNPEGGAGMPGALSDRDLMFLQSMVPSLANSSEGNKLILDTFKRLSERSIETARLAREYRRTNPRGTFDDGFYDYLAEWSAKNPLFTNADYARAGIAPPTETRSGPPRVGDVIDGYELIGEDYRNKANWRKVD